MVATTDFDDWQARMISAVRERLGYWIPPAADWHRCPLPQAAAMAKTPLAEAIHYAINGNGKYLRSLLLLAAAGCIDKPSQPALDMACALEMVHCYSLVHDDLPGMDNDDWRRGQLTVHRKFDEATAILVGDALQAIAFEIIVQLPELNAAAKRDISLLFIRASRAMCAGQAIDCFISGKVFDISEISYMHQHKTGALIAAAVLMGAYCCLNNLVPQAEWERDREVLHDFAQAISLGFQIRDDLLDNSSDVESLGKTPGKDRLQKKLTYATALPPEEAESYVQKEWDNACAALQKLPLVMATRLPYLQKMAWQMLYRSR